MTQRRIVLVDQYFPPDTSATARIVEDFAAACERAAVPLTVVCGFPSYEPATRPAWRPLRRVQRDGMTRYVIGSTWFDRGPKPGRACNYLTFMVGAVILVPFLTARAAFVAMTDPPMAPLLAWWVRRVGRPASVTVWVQDLHPGFMVVTRMIREGLVTRVWTVALRAALRCADHVIVLGRDMQDRVRAVADVPTRIVHNGWSGVTARTDAAGGDDGRPLRVMHFGNVGYAGPFASVLAAARQLEGIAEFVFVGSGANQGVLAGAPSNVSLVDRVPHEQVPDVAVDADLLLVGVQAGVEGYVMPSKGYEMMALARAVFVVAAPNCEMRLLVEEYACGITVDDDPAAIVTALRNVRRGDLVAMGERATAAAPQYARAAQFASLVSLLASC